MYSNYRALKKKRQIGFTCYILIEPGQLQVPFPEKKKALKNIYITNLNEGSHALNTHSSAAPAKIT